MVNKKNIFSRLNTAIVEVEKNLKVAQSNGDKKSEVFSLKQLKGLKTILEYRDSLEWIKKSDMKEKAQFCLKCNFDYEMIQEKYSIGYETAKSLVFRMSNNFESKIGSDTIDMLTNMEEDLVGAAMISFYVCSGRITKNDLFLSSVIEKLPKENCDNAFSMADCENEIEFLYIYSQAGFEKALETVDMNKLANVLYAISKDTELYRNDKKVLVNLFRLGTKMTLDSAKAELGIKD